MTKQFVSFSLLFVSIVLASGCSKANENVETVKKNSLKNFIYLQGGTFTMGDFGLDKDGKHYRLSLNPTVTPHQVTLSSYSLGKYQVTWFDYDTFLLATKRSLQQIKGVTMDTGPIPDYWGGERKPYEKTNNEDNESRIYYYLKPASVQWQDAKDYCQWLGQELNLPVDLSTEAQWEYAARDRGKKVIYANATSTLPNPPQFHDDTKPFKLLSGYFKVVPIGTYSTPNGLGFYDMDNNGREWVNDWYSETYYRDHPEITNPQGPETGRRKVIRAWEMAIGRNGAGMGSFFTFRCAVNSEKPVQ